MAFPRPRSRRGVSAAIVLLCALLWVVPSRVVAAPSTPGPASLATGFVDDDMFQNPLSPTRTLWFRRAQSIGSTWVRLWVHWNLIAPSKLTRQFTAADPNDPRYHWSSLDASVRSAAANGQNVVLMLLTAPTWALGPHAPRNTTPHTWRPSPTALGAFARAVAKRYSGNFPDPLAQGKALPRVTHFQAWNEPNLHIYLSPQWRRARDGTIVPTSPALYRRMLNAVYANVKAVQPHAFVLSAGTAPYGDPPGVDRMAPELFVRELLCLNGAGLRPESCPDPAHFDALDHHPYSINPTARALSPGGVSIPDLGKLQRILRAARRTGRALPSGPKQLWITEIDWGSSPPNSIGIPLSRQAQYLSQAFFELWRQGVSHVLWFLVRDFGFAAGSFTGGGVYFSNGNPKPAAAAFRFPFVALPARGGTLTLWGRAAMPGIVYIERRRGTAWQPLVRLATTPGGIFYAHRRLGSHLVLRARIGTVASQPWATG